MRKNSPLASQRRPDYHKQVDVRDSNPDRVTLISELFCFHRTSRITPTDSAFPPSGTAVEPFSRTGSEE